MGHLIFELAKTSYLYLNPEYKGLQVYRYHASAMGKLGDINISTEKDGPVVDLGRRIYRSVREENGSAPTPNFIDTSQRRRVDGPHGLINNVTLTEDELREVMRGFNEARTEGITEYVQNQKSKA